MNIEKCNRIDAEEITSLTLKSKNYWNYGRELMESWREELTISPEYIDLNEVWALKSEGTIIGFYAYNFMNESTLKLNFLFVDPECIGQGFGHILIQDFLNRIHPLKYKVVTLDADPHAADFYAKYGFKVVGKLKSSIKDRYLPIMELVKEDTVQI